MRLSLGPGPLIFAGLVVVLVTILVITGNGDGVTEVVGAATTILAIFIGRGGNGPHDSHHCPSTAPAQPHPPVHQPDPDRTRPATHQTDRDRTRPATHQPDPTEDEHLRIVL
ncbi:hypothetical protein Aph01nite_27170 [Acrocarpospora phusangensis]|uniref:Uncharacterized protein n=1 Tax=Acrocarpospora phusangensis TaxID=1070424 RepID=A0A919UNE7_9ACTN|nr:hypothetical protein [Acrocarpospora phusangensis]GIH24407.1 hypothetical protein Aph01nite_27170 [Acrocarpospora phusangensis]